MAHNLVVDRRWSDPRAEWLVVAVAVSFVFCYVPLATTLVVVVVVVVVGGAGVRARVCMHVCVMSPVRSWYIACSIVA